MNTILKKAIGILLAAQVSVVMAQDGQRLSGGQIMDRSGATNLPCFIKLNDVQNIRQDGLSDWAVFALNIPQNSLFKAYETFSDELGFTHTRYRQYMNGYPVEAAQVISHAKEGRVVSLNGDYYQHFSSVSAAVLTAGDALKFALKKVNGKKYMWENDEFEKASGYDFTPRGELVYVHRKGKDYAAENMRLAYKFNIYAEQPLYRANVFVDAVTGEILDEQNQICTATVVGQGVTKYSGTVTMSSDNYGTNQYRLRETGRGNGINTYNLSHSTSYSNTDFTNSSSTWNLSGTDKAASDAQWGAEMTYDYYKNVHGRNSIDGSGYALNSYMHYSNNYVNAFWNGQCMSYGDGDGTTYGIMTALDICGHEITHGLIHFTAQLGGGAGSGEPGALNEAFADIFGTSIEAYARPNQHDWLMGIDISLNGKNIRDLSDEHHSDEGSGSNCYQELSNWSQGEPHLNSGPAGHWYYLLCVGGSGTSGCGNNYNVTGITMAKAEKIAFRAVTTYFTSNTNYANARTYTENAATDLYGSCSAELTATSNAWYAVNVGGVPTTGAPAAAFNVSSAATCSMPVTMTFTNSSTNAQTYSWDFGDGGTITTASPSHTYTAAGTYTVTLVATGCSGSSTNTATHVVTVGSTGAALPLVEGFESGLSLPTGWTASTSTDAAVWQVQSTVAKTGSNCIGFNNCSGDGNTDMTGTTDYFYTNNYDFSSASSMVMTFDVAYAPGYYQGTTYSDQLKVSVSTDCGTTWTQLYSKSGTTLATAPTYTITNTTCWSPTAAQWRNESITLPSSVYGQSNVMFSFENISGWGEWVYIDNINITGTTGVAIQGVNGVSAYPNPAKNEFTLSSDKLINSVNVTDMLGNILLVEKPIAKIMQVDISSLPAGVYFVRVSTEEAQGLIKLVKE
jgi:Zn-dependent metalloprotease